MRDLQAADSPEVQRATEAILRYDDVLFREYRKGDRVLQIYVSAWRSGKIDARELAIHNPDNCWTANGFDLIAAANRPLARLAGARVATGQFRRFESRNGSLEVAYWLMVDGKPFGVVDESSYVRALATRLIAFFRSVWFAIAVGGTRTPIYFVRISATDGLERALAEPELHALVGAIRSFIAVRAGDR